MFLLDVHGPIDLLSGKFVFSLRQCWATPVGVEERKT